MFSKYRILIFSENPDELMKFYRDVLELKLEDKLDIPNDYGYMFEVNGEMKLWIGRHSEVKGKSKEPVRHIINLYTDEVQKWYKKVKASGADILCKPELTPFATRDEPFYVSTFLDPEGNCWQFMGQLGK
ncbi:MAG: VOC family protein [Patescibacteria group bacterium]|nr:VOC family protein [Patescibacteria group bacterium]